MKFEFSDSGKGTKDASARSGFSLVEVIISIAVAGVVLGGVVSAYLNAAFRAEWSAYSLAAQSQALRSLEQVRAAKWDPNSTPPVDEVMATNFPVLVEVLDIPMVGDKITYGTNITTIRTVSVKPPLRLIRVECVWPFMERGLYTNTVCTYRSPDQ